MTEKSQSNRSSGNIRVGNISNATGVAIGHGAQAVVNQTSASIDEVTKAFAGIADAVNQMPNGAKKDDAQEAVQKLEAEAQRGEQADEGRVRRWLAFLAEASEDIWDLAVTTLASPIIGMNAVIRSVAQRAQQEKTGGDPNRQPPN